MGFLPGTLQPQPGQGLGQRCLSRPPLAHTRCTAKESWGEGAKRALGIPRMRWAGTRLSPAGTEPHHHSPCRDGEPSRNLAQ